MKSVVVTFPGSNRDHDMIVALRKICGQAPTVIWYTDTDIPPVDLIVLPAAFPTAIICAAARSRRARR
jgi:phosphoribosylformylglycinamidine synthase subunit PurQ / glutaminase